MICVWESSFFSESKWNDDKQFHSSLKKQSKPNKRSVSLWSISALSKAEESVYLKDFWVFQNLLLCFSEVLRCFLSAMLISVVVLEPCDKILWPVKHEVTLTIVIIPKSVRNMSRKKKKKIKIRSGDWSGKGGGRSKACH